MEARYYNPSIGRFLSQDPVFLAIRDQNSVKEKTQQELQEILSDPQLLNSYSYARNNPLAYVDENGEWPSWSQIKTGVQAGWNLVKPFVQNKVNQVQNSWNSYNAYMKTPEAKQKSKASSLQGTVYVGPIAGIDRYVGFGVGSINSAGPQSGRLLSNGLKVGQNFGGNYGQVIENNSGRIQGLTDHAVEQFFARPDMSLNSITKTVMNPLVTLKNGTNTNYLSNEAFVVLNKAGNVVTWFGKQNFGSKIKEILKSTKK